MKLNVTYNGRTYTLYTEQDVIEFCLWTKLEPKFRIAA